MKNPSRLARLARPQGSRAISALLWVALSLSACAVGPDYRRPALDVPETFKESAGLWQPAATAPPVVETAWWTRLNDPVLDTLQTQLATGNLTIQQAQARVQGARAALDGVRAGFWPQTTLSASRQRNRNSSEESRAAPPTTTVSASASLSWEIDLWGRISRDAEAGRASLEASAEDLAAARLAQQVLLAQTYVQWRAAQQQAQRLHRAAQGYARFLSLTENRVHAGVASPLDTSQAQTQYASTAAQALDAQNEGARLEHAIAVLIGQSPSTFHLSSREEAVAPDTLPSWAIPEIPALIPSAVLENRPDIRAAERRVAAANARIGVATSAWFPTLTLSARRGAQHSALSHLLDLPHRFWSLGPSLSLALFDAGSRNAAITQAQADHALAQATYRQTVLNAFAEVEDQLAAVRFLAEEAQMQSLALQAAQRAQTIARLQYEAGINSALNVITAQNTALNAEIASITLMSRRLQAALALFKNLGGQWQAAEHHTP
jgi:NodT family efflux transporter outer membrane factor (OMF) lipoprotein